MNQPIKMPLPSRKLAAKGFDFTTNLTLDFSVFQVIVISFILVLKTIVVHVLYESPIPEALFHQPDAI